MGRKSGLSFRLLTHSLKQLAWACFSLWMNLHKQRQTLLCRPASLKSQGYRGNWANDLHKSPVILGCIFCKVVAILLLQCLQQLCGRGKALLSPLASNSAEVLWLMPSHSVVVHHTADQQPVTHGSVMSAISWNRCLWHSTALCTFLIKKHKGKERSSELLCQQDTEQFAGCSHSTLLFLWTSCQVGLIFLYHLHSHKRKMLANDCFQIFWLSLQ